MNEDLFYDMLYTGSQIDKSEHNFEYERDCANGKKNTNILCNQ